MISSHSSHACQGISFDVHPNHMTLTLSLSQKDGRSHVHSRKSHFPKTFKVKFGAQNLEQFYFKMLHLWVSPADNTWYELNSRCTMSALPDVLLAIALSIWRNFVSRNSCLFKQRWLHSHATYLQSGVWVFPSSRRATNVSQVACVSFSTIREGRWLLTKDLDNSQIGWYGEGIASQDDQFCLWISPCSLRCLSECVHCVRIYLIPSLFSSLFVQHLVHGREKGPFCPWLKWQ